MNSDNNRRQINNKIVRYLWYSALTVVLFLFLQTYFKTTDSPTVPEQSLENQQTQTITVSNLGLTVDEFKNNFNKLANDNNMELQISSITVQKGLVQNTFQYMLTDDIVLIGNVEGANDTLQKVTLLSTSTESIKPSSTIVAIIKLVINVVSPTLSTAAYSEIQTQLGLTKQVITGDAEIILGGKHYSYKGSDKLGTMFIISPINH